MDRPRRVKKKPIEDATPKLSKEERQRIYRTTYRAKVKADPLKYEEFKRKNADLKKQARLTATPEQKLAERENSRLRQAALRQRRKQAKMSTIQSETSVRPPTTRTGTRKLEDRRQKNRQYQRERRAKMSTQKKGQERERNRMYMQRRRGNRNNNTLPASVSSTPVFGVTTSSVSRTIGRRIRKIGNRFLMSCAVHRYKKHSPDLPQHEALDLSLRGLRT